MTKDQTTLTYLLNSQMDELERQKAEVEGKLRAMTRWKVEKLAKNPQEVDLREDIAVGMEVLSLLHEDKEELTRMKAEYPETVIELLEEYRCSNNPLFLWELYSLARKTDNPLPAEVLVYLDRCASHIFTLFERCYQSEKKGTPLEANLNKELLRGFEFSVRPGKRHPLTEAAAWEVSQEMTMDVLHIDHKTEKVKGKGKITTAYDEFSKASGVVCGTVAKRVSNYKKQYFRKK